MRWVSMIAAGLVACAPAAAPEPARHSAVAPPARAGASSSASAAKPPEPPKPPEAAPSGSAAVPPAAAPELSIKVRELTGSSLYVLDDAPGPPHGSYFWFNDGFVEVRGNTLRFWPPFAGKPSATLVSVPGPLSGTTPRVDPSGERIAMLAQWVGAGLGPAVGHLYVWSKAKGLRRLLATTRRQWLLIDHLEWTADGKQLAVMGTARDCPEEPWPGRVSIVQCDRVLLVDAETGHVDYRSPAGLDARSVSVMEGKIVIMGGPAGKPQETFSGGLGSLGTGAPIPSRWYELDAATQALTVSGPPSATSPDGRFRIVEGYPKLQVRTADGTLAYEVFYIFLTDPPRWRGDHHYQGFNVVLDLLTRQAQKLWPDDFSQYALSADGQSAIVGRTPKGGRTEMRWARPR